MNCATTVGTRIILDIMITSFVVHFGWSGLSPKNPASGNIFYFFFPNGYGSHCPFYYLRRLSLSNCNTVKLFTVKKYVIC